MRILTDSAEKAKAQFANRFIPSRFVTSLSPDEFKARWCLRGYLDPDVMSGSTQSPDCVKAGTNTFLTDDCEQCWNQQLGDIPGTDEQCWNQQLGDIRGTDALDRKQRPLYSVPIGAVILILGNIYGLNDVRCVCLYSGGNLVCSCGRHKLWWILFFVFQSSDNLDTGTLCGSGKLAKACFAGPTICTTKTPKNHDFSNRVCSEKHKSSNLLRERKCERNLLTKLKSMRFVV